jgi:hypothetical protein
MGRTILVKMLQNIELINIEQPAKAAGADFGKNGKSGVQRLFYISRMVDAVKNLI